MMARDDVILLAVLVAAVLLAYADLARIGAEPGASGAVHVEALVASGRGSPFGPIAPRETPGASRLAPAARRAEGAP